MFQQLQMSFSIRESKCIFMYVTILGAFMLMTILPGLASDLPSVGHGIFLSLKQ